MIEPPSNITDESLKQDTKVGTPLDKRTYYSPTGPFFTYESL